MSYPLRYTYSMKIKNGNEVKVDGEWFLVIDCGVVGDTIKILRADSGERFEIHEEDIEETKADDYRGEDREDFGWGGDEALCGE